MKIKLLNNIKLDFLINLTTNNMNFTLVKVFKLFNSLTIKANYKDNFGQVFKFSIKHLIYSL